MFALAGQNAFQCGATSWAIVIGTTKHYLISFALCYEWLGLVLHWLGKGLLLAEQRVFMCNAKCYIDCAKCYN